MPQALAGWLIAAGVNAIVANVVVAVGAIAVSVGLSYVVSLLNQPQRPKPSDGHQEVKQAVPDRFIHYGRVKTAGPLVFYEAAYDGQGYWSIFKAVLLSAREIDAIEQHYHNDYKVHVNESGWIEPNRYYDYQRVRSTEHLGTDDQGTDSLLNNNFGRWTSEHRLRGIAYIVVQFRQRYGENGPADQAQSYPNGEPQVSAVIRGCKVYDPRKDATFGGVGSHLQADKSTWEWSDNAALCILDYLTYEDGYDIPWKWIDIPSFMAFADLCDEDVPLKAGGTEKRYRVATTVYMTEKRFTVLQRLQEACASTVYFTAGGLVAIRGGKWERPDVILDADAGHIIDLHLSHGIDELSSYNELTFQYLSPEHDYVEVDGDPWRNEAQIAETGIVKTQPYDLMQVPSHSQARRLCKQRMYRDNPEWLGELRTNFYCLDAIGEERLTLRFPELQIDGPFLIDSDLVLQEDFTGTQMRVRSTSSAAFDWDPVLEEGDAPDVPGDTSSDASGYSAAARALFRAMADPPDYFRRLQIAQAIADLIEEGVWAKLDMLSVFAAHNSADALLNWIDPENSPWVVNGAAAFLIDGGYTGDGTTGYLSWLAPSALTHFVQDSASIGVGVRTAGAGTNRVLGAAGVATLAVNPRNGSGNLSTRLNSSADADIANASRVGRFILSRTGAAGYARYVNGAALTPVTATSVAVSSDPILLLHSAASFAADQVMWAFAGAGLTPDEVTAIDTILATYMAAVELP